MPHDSYFQGNPTRLDTSRSLMTARPRWSGTWNIGKLVPIFATSTVMPGDTFSVSIASAIRMVRPVVPVMDDMEITIEAFFIPHRLILSRKSMSPDVNDSNHSWQAFIGAQDSLLNMPTPGDVKLPAMDVDNNAAYVVGGLGDCLGYHKPAGTNGIYWVNSLKVLSYYSVWNEFFREPSTRNPVTFVIQAYGSSPSGSVCVLTGSDAGVSTTGTVSDLPLAPVSRYHGYFGSALPWPQRNSTQVVMPLGDSAPVIGKSGMHGVGTGYTFIDGSSFAGTPLTFPVTDSRGNSNLGIFDITNSGGTYTAELQYVGSSAKSNLYADLSSATAATVNQFRLAVQTQRWYEALARSGNKYSDLIHGMFGVRGPSIPDRPEYLGGFTAPINVSQVASTTPSAESSGDLGAVGAFSLSNPGGFLFSKSFTEHGTIMVVACTRVRDSFSQGIAREDQKFERFDFYWPQFANLGEQPILKKELYVDGSTGNSDDDVFGYQEAWAEYRMFNDQVTGYLNPTAGQSIAAYTYVNQFAAAPDLKGYLNAENQQANVDRTLSAYGATTGFTLFGQFEFDIKMVRPMPTYSIPGLVDHH